MLKNCLVFPTLLTLSLLIPTLPQNRAQNIFDAHVITTAGFSATPSGLEATGPEDAGISDTRKTIVDIAYNCVGVTPYVWGGEDLEKGADCSGFVWAVYETAGVNIYKRRLTCKDYMAKAELFTEVEQDEALPGDIVIYENQPEYMEQHPDESLYGHCAIYVGDEKVVHCKDKADGCVETDIQFRARECQIHFIRILQEENQ